MLLSARRLTSPTVLVSAVLFVLFFIFSASSRSSLDLPRIPHPFSSAGKDGAVSSGSEKNVKGGATSKFEAAVPTFVPHPIDDLIKLGDTAFQRLINSDVLDKDVNIAARQYRKRRGRHPPPGFDRWLEFANLNDAVVVEALFDQIYQDLEPFWAMNPSVMRQRAIDWPFAFSIRDGQVRQRASRPVAGEWLEYWEGMLKDIVQFLPDVDIAINNLDEPRMVVPWEDMENLMRLALATKNKTKPAQASDMMSVYPKRPALSFKTEDIATTGQVEDGPWLSKKSFWNIARQACPPDSTARKSDLDSDLTIPPLFSQEFPPGSTSGYVANFTSSKSVCIHPHLRNLHGSFVEPRFNSVNTSLFPLFAGCKIAGISNEILLPAAKYFSTEPDFSFSGTETPWTGKRDGLIWRGQATGGAHTKDNWKHFHRQRFVALTNGSQVAIEEHRRDHQPLPGVAAPPTNHEEHSRPQYIEVKGAFAGVEIPDPPEHPFDDSSRAAKATKILPQNQRRANVPLNAFPYPPPRNIPLPPRGKNPYRLSALATSPSTLSAWLSPKSSTGFDHLMCNPWGLSILGDGKDCGYLNSYYHVLDRVTMGEMFSHKYLPDVDGNSYSGRYLAFLRSGAVPIKATIWTEWFDSRLVAWKHFVPVDNTYADLWGVMEYFWGYGTSEEGASTESEGKAGQGKDGDGDGEDWDAFDKEFRGSGFRHGESRDPILRKTAHDEVARRIAEDGRDWAAKALRREDMLVYVYRLVLEYARVMSEERETMGWVDDLFTA